jgi:hypothetical protein
VRGPDGDLDVPRRALMASRTLIAGGHQARRRS